MYIHFLVLKNEFRKLPQTWHDLGKFGKLDLTPNFDPIYHETLLEKGYIHTFFGKHCALATPENHRGIYSPSIFTRRKCRLKLVNTLDLS